MIPPKVEPLNSPSVGRALRMGIIGFVLGALVITIIRAIPGNLPAWDTTSGLSFGIVGYVLCFGLSLRNQHNDRGRLRPVEREHLFQTLLFTIPDVLSFVMMLSMVILASITILPSITTTTNPAASVHALGMIKLSVGNSNLGISKAAVFVGLATLSLLIIGFLGMGMSKLVMVLSAPIPNAQPNLMLRQISERQQQLPSRLVRLLYGGLKLTRVFSMAGLFMIALVFTLPLFLVVRLIDFAVLRLQARQEA